MAVIQVSLIQVRSGLQENLPSLATGEFGWSVDTQRLFIGKGTLAEGAPETGVTEILTEYDVGLLNNISNDVDNLMANVSILQSNVASLQTALLFNISTLTDNTILANLTYSGNNVVELSSLASNSLEYTIVRGITSRIGKLSVTNVNGTPSYSDEYVETSATGTDLSFANIGGNVVLQYTTTSTGSPATFTYQLKSYV